VKIDRREYEERAVKELRRLLKEKRRVLAVGPTGCGKTVVCAKLLKVAKEYGRVLFLAHRYELVDQAFKRLQDAGIYAGVLMASDEARHGTERVSPTSRVQVASVQTVVRRGVPYPPDLIVFDEAHRSMADSYQAIASRYPDAEVLGLTATPLRMDGKGLGDFYAHQYTIAQPSDLYRRGYLAKPTVYSAPPGAVAEIVRSMKGVKTRGGDYAQEEAGHALSTKFLIGHIVKEAKRLAPKVPKVVFACTVKHSKRIAERFRKAGIKAVHIDGETPADERDKALADLRDGRVEVVCNVDVLGEGWDLPALGAVIIARPTRSVARLLQMTGRVQRPYKGKTPLVLDHGSNILRLQCLPGADVEDWSRFERGKEEEGDGSPVVRECSECHAMFPAGCTVCPHCGAALSRYLSEKEEREAKLVEYNENRMRSLTQTLTAIAERRGASAGWVRRTTQTLLGD
jgi:DNA repair protein RadD